MGTEYDRAFYDTIRAGCRSSADVIVPMVLEDLAVPVRSIVDVGCGEGWWAKAFEDRGIPALGIDGAYAESSYQGDRFIAADLAEPLPAVAGRFDLAVSLEVAEHLPEARAASFVADLCRLADVVLFSAAIPGQSGAGHVNCQWSSWWTHLFHRHGYGVDTWIRWAVWDDDRVEPWYRQNILIAGTAWHPGSEPGPLDVVHPIIHGWGR